jgi:general nucleoside transport system ATP-binding protein
VSKGFPGVLAVDGVSADLRRGEILGLLGENGAGKTTLMNVVFGLYQPEEGHIEVGGRRVDIPSPAAAAALGIGMVHQHFKLVPDMTVAENIAITPSRSPGLNRLPTVRKRLEALSERFGLDVDPRAVIRDLPLGERQRVEIMKMLYRGAEILILDEPTAALTPPEWLDLSQFLRTLTAEGKSVILITHKLDELFGVAARCTVLRDGRVEGTVDMGSTDKPALARMMVGRDVSLRFERRRVERGDALLEVDDVSLVEEGRSLLSDLNFAVHGGEILGIAGVAGNGQEELVEVLTGLVSPTTGAVRLGGDAITGAGSAEFIRAGGALIPEDRHKAGVVLDMSLAENLVMNQIGTPQMTRRGVLRIGAVRALSEQLVTEYGIKTTGVDVRMRNLSGGNQQKAVFARELHRRPRLVIAAQPTRGLDVGATEYVYGKLNDYKEEGAAILLLSIDLEEVLSLSDRIAVLYDGRILRVLGADEADVEEIGLLMGGESGSLS